MQIFYVTLNTAEEAQQISHKLLAQKLALCTNWFPITCAYYWQGEIKEEPEFVLIIKTQLHYREDIEQVINEHISYTNCVAEISVQSVNEGFLKWLNAEVPPRSSERARVKS